MNPSRVSSLLTGFLAVLAAVALGMGTAQAATGVCESLPGGAIELESAANPSPTGYTTMGAAFAAINSGAYTGAITIDVCGDTIEAGSAVLNASATGGASYTGITISPAGGAARTISGAIAGSLIDLNGADSVFIDGLNAGGNVLTFENTTTGTAAATIRFLADASSDTVQNCTLKGASTGTASGTLVFGAGTLTGNVNDTISANTITASGTNLPVNAIYSAGAAGIANAGIAVTNNLIQDFFGAATASNGILVFSNSASWTITGNKFFQTASRNSTSGVTHRAINIMTSGGGGYTVNNNTIGYASSSGTGTMTYTATAASLFRGIELTVAASPASEVHGNTVTAISFSTTSGLTTSPGIFAGISVLGGNVNIGTSSGNTIGSGTTTSAITVVSTTSLGLVDGIAASAPASPAATFNIQNNAVGGILASSSSATIGYTVRGIDTAGTNANVTLTNNTIGSTTAANSIQVGTSASPATSAVTAFAGLFNTGTGTITITNNTIQNYTVFSTGASVYFGINNSGGSGTLTITGNSVIGGTRTGTTGNSDGIVSSAAVATANVNNNAVKGINFSATSGSFRGVEVSGAVTTAINLNDNVLGDATTDYFTSTNATTGVLVGILANGGTATAALSVQRNDIRGVTYTTSASRENDYIQVGSSAGTLTQTIKDNTFTNLNVLSTGSLFLVRVQGSLAANGTRTVTNNNVVTAFNKTGTGGSVTGLGEAANGAPSATAFISNNKFWPITVSDSASITCVNSQDTAGRNIQNSVCTNLTGGNGSSLTGITISAFTGTPDGAVTVSGNTITNFSSAGTHTGILINGSAPNVTVASNTINTFTTTNGSATGIRVVEAPAGFSNNVNVTSNSISNLTATSVGVTSGISLGGITANGSFAATVSGNTISALTTGSAGTNPNGIGISASTTTANVFKNRIYDIQLTAATGTVQGISAGGGTNTVSNNLIGDLRAPSASSASIPTIMGINVSGTAVSVNADFNTVYLAASSSGTPFSTAAVLAGSGTVMKLRNNILANVSTPTGTGKTVALWRNYVPLWNYDTVSNNNDFYAPTVYFDGTTVCNSMSDLWGLAYPRETASFSTNPPFQSTVGTNPAFLHIVGASTTLLESHAANIAGITDDFDGEVRQGNGGYSGTGTAPDVGADEFEGATVGDVAPPAIAHSLLGSGAPSSSRVFTATIADATGVQTGSGIRPRIYFKKSTDPNDLTGWKYTEASSLGGSSYQLTIDYTMLNAGSVSVGETIQYFVVAQDTVATPNVGIFQGVFAAAPSSVALTSAAFPIGGTINNYAITTGIAGALTVCPSGCDYASLTNPGGLFEALNGRVFTGSVTVDLLGDSTAETGTIALNQWPEDPAANFTLTIRPGGGAARVVSGNVAGAMIKLNGADRVTIDGLNAGGNSLTINNSNTTNGAAAINLIAVGLIDAGARDNTLRNLNIVGGANTIGVYGISLSGASINTAGADNDGNTISGNTITKVYYAIYARAGSSPPSAAMDNLVISNNILGPASQGADSLGLAGIYMYGANSPTVSGNTVRNITAGAGSSGGIYLVQEVNGGSIANNTITNVTSPVNSGGASAITGIYLGSLVGGMTVSGNRIQGISNTNATSPGFGARGIIVNGDGASNTISNNVISDIVSIPGTSTNSWPLGIDIEFATSLVRVYHNSVNLYGSHTGQNAASSSAALYISSATTADIRDNVLVNSYDNSSNGNDKAYALFAQNLAATAFTNIDNNDYFANGPVGANNFVGSLNFTNYASLAAWQTALGGGKDANSKSTDPLYTSPTNLHLPAASPMLGAGSPIAGIITDADGAPRSLVKPTIGAYEIASADMTASVTDLPDPVSTGGTVAYAITVTNNGPSTATTPGLTGATPPNTTFVSVAAPAGWSCTAPPIGGTGAVTCTGGTLGASSSAVITLSVKPDYCLGSLPSPILSTTAAATASSALPDVVAANNAGSQTTAIADSGVCNDGDVCTTVDVCASGACVGTSPLSCDDGNVCTNDLCHPVTGCYHTNNTGPCDDGDGCTTLDTCSGGACAGSGPPPSCDDGNVCTDDSCVGPGGCVHTPHNCDDGDGCTADSCTPGTGCTHTVSCTEITAVTAANGLCQGSDTIVPLYLTAAGGVQSLDLELTYDPAVVGPTGVYPTPFTSAFVLTSNLTTPGLVRISLFNAAPLSGEGQVALIAFRTIGTTGSTSIHWTRHDLNEGQIPSVSHDGTLSIACGQTTLAMPDNAGGSTGSDVDVPVTVTPAAALDTFDVHVAFNPNVASASSVSLTPATTGWTLSSSTATPGQVSFTMSGPALSGGPRQIAKIRFHVTGANASQTPLDIVTGQTDSGVTTTLDDGMFTVCSCDDGDPCTDDLCDPANPGACLHPPTVCNDNSACTSDACVAGTGCVYTPISCDDSNACTADSCDTTSGCHHDTIVCDDHSVCTTDSCNPVVGCMYAPVICDDANPCTANSCNSATGCYYPPSCNLGGHVYYNRVTPVGPNPPNAGLDGPDVTKPVPNVAILRTSNLSAPSSATTDGAGLYAFPPDMGGNVTLTPQPLALSEAECTASTTAADSAKIARYSVQLEALSASERLAADVSANAHVTSFDAALVGQRAVASSCSTYVFPVKTLTGSDWFYAPVSRNYTPLSGDAVSDFVVMLYGDVTGNWQHLGPLAEEGGSAGAGSSIGSGKLTAEGADTNGIAEATAGNLTFPKIGATASGVANSALATLYLASAPHQLANGAWQVALGLQAADGILGLDMSLQYDPARIRIQGVTTVGLASSFGSVQNDLGLEYGVGLFGISPMQGTGSFLLVTYEARQPVTGVPFQISAEANEGQIPVDFAPGLPGGPRPSRITTDE